jgi:hypothetical protein
MAERKTRKTTTIEVEGVIVGRDKKVIPAQDVEKLASIGCKNHEICDWFGLDENTLTYNFSVELTRGRASLKQSLRRAQLRLALSGNATMLIWLGKQMLGQQENPVNTEESAPLPWAE